MPLAMRVHEFEHALDERVRSEMSNQLTDYRPLTEAEREYFLTPDEYDRFIEEAYAPAGEERTMRAWPKD